MKTANIFGHFIYFVYFIETQFNFLKILFTKMRGINGLLSLSQFVLAAQLGIQTIRFSDVLSPSFLGQGSFWIPDLSIIITIASF